VEDRSAAAGAGGWLQVLTSGPGLSQVDGVDPLGTLIRAELEVRWARGTGLLDSICHYALVPTGKLLRPIMLLESALAVGGDLNEVLPAAVGAECGHVASLIHDDIIDDDDLRRGRPSVQHKFGIGDAIVAGDALIFDLFASLAECRRMGVPGDRVVSALEAVARAGRDLCQGQTLESELTRSISFDEVGYLTVARLKTGSLFKGACECGAILGGGRKEWTDALAAYGAHLGVAFQIQDDLLAYVSDTGRTGKPAASDIQNGRVTLPVILAHNAADTGERRVIREAIGGGASSDHALETLRQLLHRAGSLAAARAVGHEHAERAQAALAVLPAGPSRDRLSCLAELVLTRDR
jgi:geranylgeranyl pyrophosphate synthase